MKLSRQVEQPGYQVKTAALPESTKARIAEKMTQKGKTPSDHQQIGRTLQQRRKPQMDHPPGQGDDLGGEFPSQQAADLFKRRR